MNLRTGLLALALASGCAAKPDRLVVEPDALRFIAAGDGAALAVTALDGRGRAIATAPCEFASTNHDAVEVDRRGRVTARDSGSADIVVRCGKLSAHVPVDVELPTTIEINARCEAARNCHRVGEAPLSLRLDGIGAQARLSARVLGPGGKLIDEIRPRFEAADPGLDAARRKMGITLSPEGDLRAVGGGHFVVLVHGGSVMEQVNVEVALPEVDVVMAPAELRMVVGEEVTLKPKTYVRIRRNQLQPVSGAVLGFTSSAPQVVAVDPGGLLRARAPGRAQIVAAADSGSFAQVQVTVVSKRSELDQPVHKAVRKKATGTSPHAKPKPAAKQRRAH